MVRVSSLDHSFECETAVSDFFAWCADIRPCERNFQKFTSKRPGDSLTILLILEPTSLGEMFYANPENWTVVNLGGVLVGVRNPHQRWGSVSVQHGLLSSVADRSPEPLQLCQVLPYTMTTEIGVSNIDEIRPSRGSPDNKCHEWSVESSQVMSDEPEDVVKKFWLSSGVDFPSVYKPLSIHHVRCFRDSGVWSFCYHPETISNRDPVAVSRPNLSP